MYNPDNIFAQIIQKELPANIQYEDDMILAFDDISPQAPIHVLVIPKGEYIDYTDFITKAPLEVIAHYFQTIEKIIKKLGIENQAYRLITNRGEGCGQTVFHFHTHILSGKTLSNL